MFVQKPEAKRLYTRNIPKQTRGSLYDTILAKARARVSQSPEMDSNKENIPNVIPLDSQEILTTSKLNFIENSEPEEGKVHTPHDLVLKTNHRRTATVAEQPARLAFTRPVNSLPTELNFPSTPASSGDHYVDLSIEEIKESELEDQKIPSFKGSIFASESRKTDSSFHERPSPSTCATHSNAYDPDEFELDCNFEISKRKVPIKPYCRGCDLYVSTEWGGQKWWETICCMQNVQKRVLCKRCRRVII